MRAPDSHFPAVHLRPPVNWINDPNGLVFHDGYYHVYFQYNPHSARHADMHWGHYRSP
ncbi:glycosyl hydrolase, partial [Streptomyces sp. NPDC058960]